MILTLSLLKDYMLLLAQYQDFNENKVMSKFKDLFNKLFTKKSVQESAPDEYEEEILDEEIHEFEEVEEEIIEPELTAQTVSDADEKIEGELEGYHVGEETVVFDGIELSEELIPHESNAEAQIPSDDQLQYPQQKSEIIKTASEEEDLHFELEDEDDFDFELNENIDPVIPEVGQQSINSTIVENELPPTPIEEPESIPEIPQVEVVTSQEENTQEDSLREEEELAEEYEYVYEDEVEVDEQEEYDEHTGTESIDLDVDQITFKDRVDQIKLRVKDQFTKFKNKEYSKEKAPKPKLNFDDIKHRTQSIQWSQLSLIFFSKKFRTHIHRSYQVSIVLLLAYFIPKIIGLLLSGSTDYNNLTKKNYLQFDDSQKLTSTDVGQLENAKLFKTDQVMAKQEESKKVINTNKVCTEATKKSDSSTKLINTIVLQDSVKSIASVQMKSSSNELESIREGTTLPGNLKVDRIDRLKLIVKNLSTGECEYIEGESYTPPRPTKKAPQVLSSAQSKEFKKRNKKLSGIETDGNNFKIDKKFLQTKLKDMNSILTQAKGIPIRNPDGTLSFKIIEVEEGGVFDYLGITNEDIITQINGNSITDMTEVMGYLGKISNLPNLNLTIKRNGEEVTQNYSIK